MEITKESTGELTATIQVEIVKDDYQEQVETVLRDYRRKANIPGFRPGKVPFGMIKKMYGKSVLIDEVNKIIGEGLQNYLKENEIEIIGQPLPNPEKSGQIDFDNGEEFSFFFDIGITPQFDLSLDDSVVLNYYHIDVDDTMIDNYINDVAMRHGKDVEADEAKDGDLMKGTMDELDQEGNKLENGISNETTIALSYIKDEEIKEKITGIKPGESVDFNPMTATGNATEVASMLNIQKEDAEKLDSDFRFSVDSISRIEPAELNEDFFKHMYPNDDIKTEEEYRKRAAKDLAKSFTPDCDRQFMNDSIKKLVEESDIPLPDEFMKRFLIEANQGKITEEDLDKEYDSYARTIRWQLIENKILKENDISVKEEEIKAYISNYFSLNFKQSQGHDHSHDHDHGHDEDHNEELPPEQQAYLDQLVNSVMQNQEEVQKINDYLYDNKLRDLFKASFKIEEKNISYDDFVKLATENK